MKKLCAITCALLVGSLLAATPARAQISASFQRTTTPPVIDGLGDDAVWAGATAHSTEDFTAFPPDAYEGDSDAAVIWKALWDDENLYVFVDIFDDEIVNEDSCSWEDDSIEFYIDAQNTDEPEYNPATIPGIPAFQFTAIAGSSIESFCGETLIPEGTTSVFTHGINSYDAPDRFDTEDDITEYIQGADTSASVIVDDNHWTFEVSFPWAALEDTPANIQARGEMGFGVAYNDDDDGAGRDTQLIWASTVDDLWHVAASMPSVALSNETVGGGGTTGDFNGDGVLDSADIDDLTHQSALGTNPAGYDLNADALVNDGDIGVWVKDLKNSWIGDANLDGEFSSSDLVVVLSSGTYEADVDAVWTTGDFNGDGRSNSSDLVAALSDGGYELGPRAATAAVPEPSTLALLGIGALLSARRMRRR